MNLRVAGLQMPVGTDIAANGRLIEEYVQRAADAGAEILLTPEGALSGYRPDFDRAALAAALDRVTACARARRVGLALGTCFAEADGRCYNQVRLYRPGGDFLGFHAKTLRCAGSPPRPSDEINHYAACELRTFEWAPGLRVGALICNDVWANPYWTPMPDPHLVRQLADKGARVIFHAVNGGRDAGEMSRLNWQYHEVNLRMRAGAAGVWIVTVDNAEPVALPCSAPSGVLNPTGAWACRAPDRGLQLFVHTLELDQGGGPANGQPPCRPGPG